MTLTRQEIFDKAWLGLKAQGFQQSIDGGACMYRGKDGRKCAIGHCIPDARYFSGLEGKPAESRLVAAAADISMDDAGFACDLQRVHDNFSTPSDMEIELRLFASIRSLTIPNQEDAA